MFAMQNLAKYYRVLDLEPGASDEDVNQAYKDLAFIWHPDRIPKDNERLQQKAIAKLQEINQAREQLRASRRNKTATTSTYQYPARNAYAQSRYKASSASSQQTPNPPPKQQQKTTNNYKQYSPPRSNYEQNPASYRTPNYQAQPQTKSKTVFPKSQVSFDPDPLVGADLHGVDYKEKDFSGRNLSRVNFSNANLSDSFLHRVNFQEANLEKANLFRANLLEANLEKANLREANLIGADLSGANLSGADLRGAKVGSGDRLLIKLTGTILTGTILPDGSVHS